MGDMDDVMDLVDLIMIQIKIMHSTTRTLSVERTILVSELKQEISYYWGISPERQHLLLFRGRVLKDDQRLSDYHIEEGHTLYLVEGPPPEPRLSSNNAAANSNLGLLSVSHHSYQLAARRYDAPYVVIPDSITTLSLHLNRLRGLFGAYGMINRLLRRRSREDQIARESNWAELAHTTRRLLIGEVAEFLSHITMLLEDQVIVMIPSARRSWQESVVESGSLLCDLGSSLLALGHAISRISMGETQDDVGRAVFVSPTRQNRLQSHHSWLQTSIEAGRSIRVVSQRRRLSRDDQEFEFDFFVSRNADNTSSPQLTADEELSDSDSEHERW